MAANEILKFSETDTGTNLLTQAAYLADAQRLIGNQPGIARDQLVNKVLRQVSAVAAGVAKFIADFQSTDVTDSLTAAQVASMLEEALNSGVKKQGQGRLTKVGANLLLSPFNGNRLSIGVIPAAGVTLAPPATTNTTYYIYAVATANIVTSLEASATIPAVDATTGNMIKTGDATRLLVGMARTVASAWVDTEAQRFVLSWFNQRGLRASIADANNRTTTSAVSVEITTALKVEFLTWAASPVVFQLTSSLTSSVGGNQILGGCFDGTLTEARSLSSNSSNTTPVSISDTKTDLSEGYHYFTQMGQTSVGAMTLTGGVSQNVSSIVTQG